MHVSDAYVREFRGRNSVKWGGGGGGGGGGECQKTKEAGGFYFRRERERIEREKNILFFSLYFFLRSTKSDRRFSSGLKVKLIYVMRASVDTKKLEFRQTP